MLRNPRLAVVLLTLLAIAMLIAEGPWGPR